MTVHNHTASSNSLTYNTPSTMHNIRPQETMNFKISSKTKKSHLLKNLMLPQKIIIIIIGSFCSLIIFGLVIWLLKKFFYQASRRETIIILADIDKKSEMEKVRQSKLMKMKSSEENLLHLHDDPFKIPPP